MHNNVIDSNVSKYCKNSSLIEKYHGKVAIDKCKGPHFIVEHDGFGYRGGDGESWANDRLRASRAKQNTQLGTTTQSG